MAACNPVGDGIGAGFGRIDAEVRRDAGQKLIAASYRDREENKPLLAVPIYESLIAQDATNAGTYQRQLADAYREAGKYKEAIGTYQQSEYFPHNLDQIAQCYRAMKQYKEAIGVYTQIVAGYEPQAPEAMLNIARTYEADGKPENAIKTLQTVCKKYPKSGQASTAHQHLNNVYKITVTMGGAKEE